MNVLVTGAYGNLGCYIIDQLLADGYQVTSFDLDSEGARNKASVYPQVKQFWGDIRDHALLEQVLKGQDVVIHNAAVLPPVTELNPGLAEQINVAATAFIIDTLRAQENPALLIYPSSLTVFGPNKPGSFKTPQDAIVASDGYTEHKIACEKLIREAGIPYLIFRVGVSIDHTLMKPDLNTLLTMLAVQPDSPLEYVHPRDVATAFVNSIKIQQSHNQVLLMGGGKNCQITQRDFLQGVFGSLGLWLPKSIHGSNHYYTHWLDTELTQQLLQYQTTSFNDLKHEIRKKFWWARPLLTALSPLAAVILMILAKRQQSKS